MSLDNRNPSVRYLEAIDGLEIMILELQELAQNNDIDAEDRVSRVQALQLAIESLKYEIDTLRGK